VRQILPCGNEKAIKGDGRILLGDNTEGQAVTLRAGVCISAELP